MTELFRRSFRLAVADKEFSSVGVRRPLAFSFSVQREQAITPNNVNVLLFNLNSDTRDAIAQLSGQDGVVLRLEAGYGEDVGQLFFGVLRKAQSWREGGTWHTQISGGDKEKEILNARINKTFPAGTPVTTVLENLVEQLGVGAGGLTQTVTEIQSRGLLTGGQSFPKALTLNGSAAQVIDQFMRSLGFKWSVQDGNFYAGPSGVATIPGQGPILTPDTGLLGIPQIDKKGQVVGSALLDADLIPGRVFRVESERVTGDFVCQKTQHMGESDGSKWEVQFVGAPPESGSAAS